MRTAFSGIFVTIEGIEGVGKSTIVHFIENYLQQQKISCLVTREPGGTPIAENIRKLCLALAEETLYPETELLLMFASRLQHSRRVILPALQAGKWVVSDRFVDASYAYQGGGRGIDLSYITFLDQWLVNPLKPQRTILLDAPYEVGFARTKTRGVADRIEREKCDFFARVRAMYLQRAALEPDRFRVIDATQPLLQVQKMVKTILDTLCA